MLHTVFVIIFVQNSNFIMVSEVVGFSRNWENLTAIEFTTTMTMTNRSDTLSWCQRVVRISRNKEFTVIELTQTTTTTTVNSRRNLHTHTAFQEAFREDFF